MSSVEAHTVSWHGGMPLINEASVDMIVNAIRQILIQLLKEKEHDPIVKEVMVLQIDIRTQKIEISPQESMAMFFEGENNDKKR